MSKPYHYPKGSSYTTALCGQWTEYTVLKISKVSPTCKKCLRRLYATKNPPTQSSSLEELEDAINEEVSLAIHKFHVAKGGVLINPITRQATDEIMHLFDQYARAIALEAIGEDERTSISPDDDYEGSEWERDCQNQRNGVRAEQRSRLDTLLSKPKGEE